MPRPSLGTALREMETCVSFAARGVTHTDACTGARNRGCIGHLIAYDGARGRKTALGIMAPSFVAFYFLPLPEPLSHWSTATFVLAQSICWDPVNIPPSTPPYLVAVSTKSFGQNRRTRLGRHPEGRKEEDKVGFLIALLQREFGWEITEVCFTINGLLWSSGRRCGKNKKVGFLERFMGDKRPYKEGQQQEHQSSFGMIHSSSTSSTMYGHFM